MVVCIFSIGSITEKYFMTIITSREIAQFRSQLAEDAIALEALDLIEDCEGDLEDAAMTLAIRAGLEPQRDNSEWLDAIARRWRTTLCQNQFRSQLRDRSIQELFTHLKTISSFPQPLAVPILLYITKYGIDSFCAPLDSFRPPDSV